MTYRMNGRPIEATSSHAYLGIGINNKLSWAEHISNTASRQIRSVDYYVVISIVVFLLVKKPLISHWLDRG